MKFFYPYWRFGRLCRSFFETFQEAREAWCLDLESGGAWSPGFLDLEKQIIYVPELMGTTTTERLRAFEQAYGENLDGWERRCFSIEEFGRQTEAS